MVIPLAADIGGAGYDFFRGFLPGRHLTGGENQNGAAMVRVKRALSTLAQEALELIAGASVFHTVQDTGSMHLHAQHGNATLTLVVPMATWAELRPLVEWTDAPVLGGQVLRCKQSTTVRLFDKPPVPSNEVQDVDGMTFEQLDLPLPTLSDHAALEAAGQQTLNLSV